MAQSKYLRIVGDGGTGGGKYDEVRIVGNGTVSGDLECPSLRVVGTSHFYHRVEAHRANITGTAEFKNNLHITDKMKLSGTAEIHGDLAFKSVQGGGTIHVHGKAGGDEVSLHGGLRAGGDFAAEIIKLRGNLNIAGLLNVGELDLKMMYGPCSAKEIGGDRINVRLAGMLGIVNRWFSRTHESILTVETIEGDEISLENTHARFVRGNRVKIGPGCQIDLVEYKSELVASGQATIKEKRQVIN